MADVAQPAALLDFSKPIDVGLLDATVAVSMQSIAGGEQQRNAAEKVLLEFQEHPQAWTRVDTILEVSQNQPTKYFALQILESVIRWKWGALPMEQREGIKNYLSNFIIRFSTSEELFRKESTFVNKLNILLVQILKHDWPARWKSFIPDLVAASRTSETLCENSMKILKLLSEEVFDFGRLDLTQAKTKELKQTLTVEFKAIHELCVFVLNNTRKPELIRSTLETLSVFLTWVPLGYIFEGNLLEMLLQLFPQAPFRNVSLQCLTEVGSLQMAAEFNPQFAKFYDYFMRQLLLVVPPNVNLPEAYEKGTDDQQKFVQNLALFFTSFFKAHIGILETAESSAQLVTGLEYLVNISYVDNTEVFKTCLDYWYVVGQYPKFLRAHWKFLKTVVNKLFEFMHETHPGVQDMACDTFLKICNKCRRKFVVMQVQEREPFICELLNGLTETIQDLQPHQIHTFYEAVGLMIGAESDPVKRDDYLHRLMGPPNTTWSQILVQARANPEVLKQQEVVKSIQNVLQTNVSVCTSLGQPFLVQFNVIFTDMLQVYRLYSELISQAIATGGANAARTTFVKYMRSVKKVALKLIETFVDKCDDPQLLAATYVPAMMDPLLGDYPRSVPDARTLFLMSAAQLKLVIDSIVWAFRHTERNVAETGLALLHDLLVQFAGSEYATQFHQTYYLHLLNEILAVMTDSFHKPGLKSQARILHHLFTILDANVVKAPLWDVAAKGAGAYPTNSAFVRVHVVGLLSTSFPNLTQAQVAACVSGMFEYKDFSAFKHHLRDFLVQTKQFASQDNADLFAEDVEKQVVEQRETRQRMLAAIPGMIPQAELVRGDDMNDA
ncbi:Exportin-1 [Tetrabaena socialis]|uniref:Exportin-1 n=1 Tax=Tetrabaena socialis TaxID=47790 RepID=A0A2J7ZUH0_9CHLO|nr:Exportin-1 [Tetrabaena socialis]|eukprot:PNH03912.1 Exportin-1 [Tetrabaena socialis]